LPGTAHRWVALALILLLSCIVVFVIPFDALPWLRGPAESEWRWDFRTSTVAHISAPGAGLALLLVALILLSGAPGVRRRGSAWAGALTVAAVALGFAFHIALVDSDGLGRLRTMLRRTLSSSVTAYHTVALNDARDPAAFLRAHATLASGLPLHASTHPPGPVLYYRAMIGLCERSPSLTAATLAVAGVQRHEFSPPLTGPARAAALLGVLLLELLGSLVPWPLARLASALGMERLSAARLALLWALLPGPSLMDVRFDQAMALAVATYAVLIVSAVRHASPSLRLSRAMLAGVAGGVAIFFSYGSAIFLVAASLAVLAAALAAEGSAEARRAVLARWALACGLSAAVGLALAFGGPTLVAGWDVRVMIVSLTKHVAFNRTRSYLAWLAFNPLDLAIFLGVPIALLAAWQTGSRLRRAWKGMPLRPLDALGVAIVAGALVLTASGLTRGEVGRMWIPLMPFLMLGAFDEDTAGNARIVACIGLVVAAETIAIGAWWSL
jgi:hypothetical protein